MNRLRPNPLPAARLGEALRTPLDALPDEELLARYAGYSDHAAFDALLRRHGPMVFGVCRRTLGHTADADDAFQAAFLVFIRKARTVRGERLGPWLYGVAWRVAQKARARAARLAAHRSEGLDMLAADESPAPDWLPILDAELNALPAKYRDALVLCELQGASRAEAAKALGLREGTLSSRLSRGRDLLRRRLLKHGTLLPLGGLGALFSAGGVGRGSVPGALLAAVSEIAKGGAAGAVPAGAARLTDEVLKAMFLTKLRVAGAAVALAALVTAGAAAGWPREALGPEPESVRAAKAVPARAARPDDTPAKPRPADGPDVKTVQGYWKLEKLDVPPKWAANHDVKAQFDMVGRFTSLLIEGDVWWLVEGNRAGRHEMRLTPERNPKWLDSPNVRVGDLTCPGMRGIYRLPDADTLEFCTSQGGAGVRPAEFVADDEFATVVCRFKRAALPEVPADRRAARAPLHGTWAPSEPVEYPVAGQPVVFTPHFAFLPERANGWDAYTYEVDAGKDPAWIDLTAAVQDLPARDAVPKPIHGVYARRGPNDAMLTLALGGDKRIARPLEFVPEKGKVRVLNLSRADANAEAPMPKAK